MESDKSAKKSAQATPTKSSTNVYETTVREISEAADSMLRAGGKTGGTLIVAMTELLDRTINGAAKIGSDIGETTKGAVVGLMRAAKASGEEVTNSLATLSAAVVKMTSKAGGDTAKAAEGAVAGAISAAREFGRDAAAAASSSATAAVSSAYGISREVGESVRDTLHGTIDGVRVVLAEPFRPEPRNG